MDMQDFLHLVKIISHLTSVAYSTIVSESELGLPDMRHNICIAIYRHLFTVIRFNWLFKSNYCQLFPFVTVE